MLWLCDGDTECSDGKDESQELCSGIGKCGGNFNSSSGILTSPSYPNKYPENADCVYTISQEMGSYIKLVAMAMELENDVDCLEVRDGDSDEAPLLGKFCGKMPSTISSTQNNMWLR